MRALSMLIIAILLFSLVPNGKTKEYKYHSALLACVDHVKSTASLNWSFEYCRRTMGK